MNLKTLTKNKMKYISLQDREIARNKKNKKLDRAMKLGLLVASLYFIIHGVVGIIRLVF